ncbi:hypothetical protein [Acetoanaerobium noterae]|uniref:hypothetical protein n=1 Tax=Acetoanaerobium noterae TaxID=745369 RepID=UPI0028B06F00|nr:hypothetical protein [Acetoanaerobium noterae]
MKTLKFNQEEYKAEKIIKTENSIIGQDLQGNEVFAFRGISDFALFELEEGQSFDMDEKELLKQELTKTNSMVLELTEIILGGM